MQQREGHRCGCGEIVENKPDGTDYWLNKQGRIISPIECSNGHVHWQIIPLDYVNTDDPADPKLAIISASSVAFTLGRRAASLEVDRIVQRLRRVMPVSEIEFIADRDPAVIRSMFRGSRQRPLRDVQSHIAAQLFPAGIPGAT